MTTTHPTELPPPEEFAALLASQLQPGLLESLVSADNVAGKTEKLVDYMEYEGRGAWQNEPHLDILCNKLEDVAQGKIKRLMVFMPPRHGKSQVCSKKFPAWYLRKFPDRYIMITSYSADLAFDFSRIARNTIQDEREIFPNIGVSQQARAVKHWTLEGRKGGLIAAGVGGPITGRGASVAIIDDPFKNYEEAASATVRESVWQWYRSTLRTRLDPNGAIVLIMTRWHQDDMAGRLLAEMKEGTGEDWEVISLPGIADNDDPLGRKAGEALSPRFPINELLTIKKALGGYLFGALYQQTPRAKEGNYFKDHWFIDAGDTSVLLESWRKNGHYVSIYAAMDFAIGEKQQNDWNVIDVAAISPEGENILIDRIRFKDDADGIADEIVNVQRKYKPLLFGFEEGQIRKAIWPTVIRKMKDAKVTINSQFLVPIGDKIARARTGQGQMRQGQWLFSFNADWFEDFKEWMLGFPNATFDDDTDAFAHLSRLIEDVKQGIYDPTSLDGVLI